MPPSLAQSASNAVPPEDLASSYRRAFQRELRHRPTALQRSLMETAAITAARFDRAARDPDIGAQDLAHLERVARRAAEAMRASFRATAVPDYMGARL